MNKVCEILSHLCVILSLMFLVFLALDQFNPMMNFVNNPISNGLLAGLCVCSLGHVILRWKQGSVS